MSWCPVADAERDGERLAVFRGPGSGPPLVLVHGLEDTWRSWQPVVDRLTDDGAELRFTPYALDLPWRAGADYRWVHRTDPATLLRHALALLPQPAAVLLGHSFGANAVLEHLPGAGQPQPVGVVLLAPYFRPPEDPVNWQLFDRELARFRAVIGEGVRLRLGDRRQTLDPALVDAMVAKALDRVGPLGFVALLRQFITTTDLDLSTVTAPTLVIAGATDPSLAGPRADALRHALPTATVHTRADGGHFCHIEQAAVAVEIRRFLAALPTPATV